MERASPSRGAVCRVQHSDDIFCLKRGCKYAEAVVFTGHNTHRTLLSGLRHMAGKNKIQKEPTSLQYINYRAVGLFTATPFCCNFINSVRLFLDDYD